MEISSKFESLWGKVLVELKAQAKRALYAEATAIKNGEVNESEVIAYIKYNDGLLFDTNNKKIIEDIIEFFELSRKKFVLKVYDEQKQKQQNLKKMFGDSLEIL